MPIRVVQKILERFEQERAKPATIRIGMLEPITFQHHKEKILGEILRVLGRMATPADERQKRPPIKSAEFRQGPSRSSVVAREIGRSKDKTPTRRREVSIGAGAFHGHSGVHGGR
jgi:hypothetical protein